MKGPLIGACWAAAFVVGWAVGRHPAADAPRADVMPWEGGSGVRESRSWSPEERLGRLRALAGLSHPRLEERIEMEKHLAGLPLEEVRRLSRMEIAEPWKQ